MVSTQGVSISIAWAISQYQQALATIGMVRRGLGAIRAPKEPPEVTAYFRAIGIGRSINVYA